MSIDEMDAVAQEANREPDGIAEEQTPELIFGALRKARESEELPLMDRLTSEMRVSVRARKAMQLHGIRTFRQLTNQSAEDLLAMRNVGETVLREIEGALQRLGLRLRGDLDAPTVYEYRSLWVAKIADFGAAVSSLANDGWRMCALHFEVAPVTLPDGTTAQGGGWRTIWERVKR